MSEQEQMTFEEGQQRMMTKIAAEILQVEIEHPTWPRSQVVSEAMRRVREKAHESK
jgi:hypothetical protein